MAEPMPADEITRHIAVLNDSRDADELTASAVALAASENRDAVVALARSLRSAEFLARLEGSTGPTTEEAINLGTVFGTLAGHPSSATGRLCELIYGEPAFAELPARINFLLGALAAVVPVTPAAEVIFRETNSAGYATVNAPLLLRNGDPLALTLFQEIIAGDWVSAETKVDILHRSVLPLRDRLPILHMCTRLLGMDLGAEVRAGIIETLFDYKSRAWFGPAMSPPLPPDWQTAPTESLQFVIRLAERLGIANDQYVAILKSRDA